MEDGGYGFDRASRAPGEMSVLCLGRLFECSPFFLGCDVISDCFLTCSPNQPGWFLPCQGEDIDICMRG